MDVYMRVFAESLAQLTFEQRCPFMRLFKRRVALHPDMYFDGDVFSDASGTQIVRVEDIRRGTDDVENLLLGLFGQGTLRQLAHAAA